jgi:ubiquinone biosynthesis monooxygenase Coq7
VQKKRESSKLESMLRVNHAGEMGAIAIYEGQLAVLGRSDVAPQLDEMLAQEQEHFAYFDDKLKETKTRPTVLSPLWKVGGFALGAVTAMIGRRAAMACTVAVEEVISEHYQEQLDQLPDTELSEKIMVFRSDEMHHEQVARDYGAEYAPFHKPLTMVVKGITRAAIFASKRI